MDETKNKYQRFLDWLLVERKVVDATSNTLANNMADLIEAVGLLAMPAVPASLGAISVFHTLAGLWPGYEWLAILIGLCVGVGFEAFGLGSAHNSVRAYQVYRHRQADWVMIVFVSVTVLVYAIVVGSLIAYADAFPGAVRIIAPFTPAIAVLLYVSRFLGQDLTNMLGNIQQRVEQDLEVELVQHAAKMKQIEAQALQRIDDEAYRLKIKREHDRDLLQIKADAQRMAQEAKIEAKYGGERLSVTEARIKARQIWLADPTITGAELGRSVGRTPRWGQQMVSEFSQNGGER